MKYYIAVNIGDDYNIILNKANKANMLVNDYIANSIISKYDVKVLNVHNEHNAILFDVISSNQDDMKNFISDYFKDDDHYNLIHEIII